MTLIVEDKKLIQSTFPMTPTARLALYYLPTYGLRLMDQQIGETVSTEGIVSSIETHKIMPALRVILEKAKQAREAEIQKNLMDFLNQNGDKVITLGN